MAEFEYGIRPDGFRLPDATHVGAVVLQVSDLERSRTFYRDVLGFTELSAASDHVKFGADRTLLIELHAGAKEPLRTRRLGLYHFAILLPDRAALGRVLEHLVHNGIQPGAADHLVSEALYLNDPDGLGIEIYRDRPRNEWTAVQRQLNMSTDPLDFDAVLAEGRGEAWTGMPAGTVIGHVHLHVGDIEQARAFYHQAIGLDVMVWTYPGALFLAAGGYHHHLGTNIWAGPQATAPAPDEPQLLEWQLVLPEDGAVMAVAGNAASRGYAVTQEGESVLVRDPWGTAVRLRGPDTDRV